MEVCLIFSGVLAGLVPGLNDCCIKNAEAAVASSFCLLTREFFNYLMLCSSWYSITITTYIIIRHLNKSCKKIIAHVANREITMFKKANKEICD